MHRDRVLINGVEAPSVTQVLGIVRKEFLEKWRGKLGNKECDRIMHESQEIGHRIHDAIECYFRGEEIPELPQVEAKMFALFKGWALKTRFTPIELELTLENKQYGYHGATDAIGTFGADEQIWIWDWKTSSKVDDLYGAQLAAYAAAYSELTGKFVNAGGIVRLDKKKEGVIEVKEFPDLKPYFEIFLHALELYNFTKKKGKWAK